MKDAVTIQLYAGKKSDGNFRGDFTAEFCVGKSVVARIDSGVGYYKVDFKSTQQSRVLGIDSFIGSYPSLNDILKNERAVLF